jgi:hypothetical protein
MDTTGDAPSAHLHYALIDKDGTLPPLLTGGGGFGNGDDWRYDPTCDVFAPGVSRPPTPMDFDNAGPQTLGPRDSGRCIRSTNDMLNPVDQILRYANSLAVTTDSSGQATIDVNLELTILGQLLGLIAGTPYVG